MVASGSSSSPSGLTSVTVPLVWVQPWSKRLFSSSTVASRAMTSASKGEAGGLAELKRALTDGPRRSKVAGEGERWGSCMLARKVVAGE